MEDRHEQELAELRGRIADLDRQILDLVALRLLTTRRVGETKKRASLPIRDFRVEVEVMDRARSRAERSGLDPVVAERLMRVLIEAAVDTQRGIVEGTYEGSRQRILVVGGSGRMGGWLCRFLGSYGHQVRVTDPRSEDGPFPRVPLEAGVEEAEVVALATPIGETPEVLQRVLAAAGDPLVFDICSLKSGLETSLRRAASEGRRVTSLHPMFAPGTTILAGRALLVCDAGNAEATLAARTLFADSALGLYEVPLEEHDRLMACLLGMSHAVNLQFAAALAESGVAFSELGRIASTTFARQLESTAEVVAENPRLYHEIQHGNRHTPQVFERLAEALERLRAAADDDDPAQFIAVMDRSREYLLGARE